MLFKTHLVSHSAPVVSMLFGRRAIKCTEKKEERKKSSVGKVKLGHIPVEESVIIL